MTFTMQQLSIQLSNPNLATWKTIGTRTPANAATFGAFGVYYAGLMQWIVQNGGTPTFGQKRLPTATLDLKGLESIPSPLGGQQLSLFTGVFYDIPTFWDKPDAFRLDCAACAIDSLIVELNYGFKPAVQSSSPSA